MHPYVLTRSRIVAALSDLRRALAMDAVRISIGSFRIHQGVEPANRKAAQMATAIWPAVAVNEQSFDSLLSRCEHRHVEQLRLAIRLQ